MKQNYINSLLAMVTTALAAAPIAAKIALPSAHLAQAEHKVFFALTVNRSYGTVDLGQWQLAVTNNRDGNDELYSLMADGSNLTRLTNNTADENYPRWSPSGKTILLYSTRAGTGRYLLDVNTHKESILIVPPVKPTRLELEGEPVWLGANDTLVYFCHTAMLCTRKADGSETSEQYIIPSFDASGTPTQTKIIKTVIAPDAKQFIFYVMNDDPNWPNTKRYALYLSDAKGGALRTIVPPTSTQNLGFAWSPTGQKLAVVQDNTVMLLEVGSGVSKTVASFDSQFVSGLAWSPDENTLWANYNDGLLPSSPYSICTMALTATLPVKPVCLANGLGPVLSPDGQWVAYLRINRHDTEIINGVSMPVGRLWLMRSDGSEQHQLNITGSNFFISWNPKPVASATKH